MNTWKGTLEQLVRERRSALVGYAYLMTGDRARAEDLVHDAIIRTFTRARSLDNIHAAEGYVKRVIATQFINSTRSATVLRAKSHLIAVPEHKEGHSQHVADSVTVHDAVMALPPQQRACIVLRFFDDQTVGEIAHTLGLADGTVKRYLHEGINHLRDHLGDVPGLDTDLDTPVVTVTSRRAS